LSSFRSLPISRVPNLTSAHDANANFPDAEHS
jgi:hypothetical protein